MKIPSSLTLAEIQTSFRDAQQAIRALEIGMIPLKGGRVTDAGKPINPFDYVRKYDLEAAIRNLNVTIIDIERTVVRMTQPVTTIINEVTEAADITEYSDSFDRALLSGLKTPWFIVPLLSSAPSGTWAQGTAQILTNQLVLTSVGPNNPSTKRAAWVIPGLLVNHTVWASSQFARALIAGESGTGSLSGPSTNINAGDTGTSTGYILGVRNGQYRLDGRVDDAATNLVAATNIGGYPVTLELRCYITGPSENTLWILKDGVTVNTVVDTTGTIQGTGTPGFYCVCQQTGGFQESITVDDFVGGIL